MLSSNNFDLPTDDKLSAALDASAVYSPAPPGTDIVCIPFRCDGENVLYLTAEQLTRYIPRTSKTIVLWAKAGMLPCIRPPKRTSEGHSSWLFDYFEVLRAMKRYQMATTDGTARLATTALPFAEIVQYLGPRELSRFIPRTPTTFKTWAKLGIIPGTKLQGGQWLFDLLEVHRTLKRYHK